MAIRKLLIANRGEIAVRIARACSELGIRSVAIHSEADEYSLHVKKADEAYQISKDPLSGYLNPHHIVNMAVETGCDALHPGYGFLSENAELAAICEVLRSWDRRRMLSHPWATKPRPARRPLPRVSR